MKLKEYAKLINDLAYKYPDVDVIYSVDDEGNTFLPVLFAPTEGIYEDLEFEHIKDKEKINVVCIN